MNFPLFVAWIAELGSPRHPPARCAVAQARGDVQRVLTSPLEFRRGLDRIFVNDDIGFRVPLHDGGTQASADVVGRM